MTRTYSDNSQEVKVTHECVDHMRHQEHEWTEPRGEHCYQSWYECRICGSKYTSAEVDQMHDDALAEVGMCDARNSEGYICTQPDNHVGDHIATTPLGKECARWSMERA